MIRSAVAGPTPGSPANDFRSCSSIDVATSRTGRTMARRAFFTPTPSTEQNRSKNSRSISLRKPIQPRRHPPLHGVAFEILDRVQADLLPEPMLQLAAGELGDQHLVFEGADSERELIVLDLENLTGDFGDQAECLPAGGEQPQGGANACKSRPRNCKELAGHRQPGNR